MTVKKIKHTSELRSYRDLEGAALQVSLDLIKVVNRNKGDTILVSSEKIFIEVKAFISSTVFGDELVKRLVNVPLGTAPSALDNRLRGIRGSNIYAVMEQKRFATFHPVIWKHADLSLKVNSHISVYRIQG
ncbi:hypothetical protein TOTORO_01760 [Serratia phage vB_SmaS-Totoro]|nr:hypothetical protein TOTORO_01760 [Serratia phage vB_SmaS-Totoro]